MVGSQGSLRLVEPWQHQPEKPAVICLRRGEKKETLAVDDINAYWCEVEAMADAILDGVQPAYSLSDSRGNVATICALLESARQGKPVPLAS